MILLAIISILSAFRIYSAGLFESIPQDVSARRLYVIFMWNICKLLEFDACFPMLHPIKRK